MYDVPPVAVSVCEPPGHIDARPGEIVPVGAEATVTTELFEAGPVQSPS